MSVPRILLLGAGRFGRVHLAEWGRLVSEGRAELLGVVVTSESSAAAVRELTDAPVHRELTDELLQAADGVDIATPASTHAALVSRALEHTHVLVEKPLAETPAEARALGEQARAAGRVLMVGHVYRFHPVVQRLKELVESIGEPPQLVRSTLTNPEEEWDEHSDVNLELLHPFDIIDHLFGLEPQVCVGRRRRSTNRISLRYPGPMNAVVLVGWQGHEKVRRIDLEYRDREIKVDFIDHSIVVASDANQVHKTFLPHASEALAAEFRAFVGAIESPATFDSAALPGAEVGARVVDVAVRSQPPTPPERPRMAIVGGGIFGTVFANELSSVCDVTVFERHDELMTEVSTLNQWRHHSGFHYPRSYDTIQEIKAAKGDFEREYGEAIRREYPSYFCTSASGVEIPAERYLAACQGNNLNFTIEGPPANVLDYSKVSICLRSDEAVYDLPKLKRLVRERIDADPRIRLELGSEVIDATITEDGSKAVTVRREGETRLETFDYLVNASYANLNLVARWFGFPVEPVRFDVYELLVLRIPIPQICVTIMDGPFTSLVGMGFDGAFMLSHIHDSVLHSVITEDGLPPEWGPIESNRVNMLRHSSRYLPVLEKAEVVHSLYATRAVNAFSRDFDARPTVVRSHGFGIWSVLGGKILTSVTNAREVLTEIRAEREGV